MRNTRAQAVVAPPRFLRRWSITCAVWLAVFSWVVCVVAWSLLFVQVETVLVTGPILLVLGVVLVGIGRGCKYLWALALGVGHVVVPLLWFLLVNMYRWAPSDAQMPFLVMGFIYLLIASPLAYLVWRRRPPVVEPWQCQSCAYPLFGLAGPQCPECGALFDPEVVSRFEMPRDWGKGM